MKNFNYKFNNSKIDDIEKVPAYKRQGLELDDRQHSSDTNISRTTLGVDENDDIYAYFRKNKIVAGIPAILAYKAGNLTIGPTYSVLGSNITEINRMFHTCVKEIQAEKSGSQTTASTKVEGS